MDEKTRKARNAYMKKWREANPEKVKAINARYWAKQAEKMGIVETAAKEREGKE